MKRLKSFLKAALVFIALFFCWVIALISLELEKPDFIRANLSYSESYVHRFRRLTLSSFKDINYGDNYSEIIKKIGAPNGEIGSGFIRPYWTLKDKSCVLMLFDYSDDGEYAELVEVRFMFSNGRGLEGSIEETG